MKNNSWRLPLSLTCLSWKRVWSIEILEVASPDVQFSQESHVWWVHIMKPCVRLHTRNTVIFYISSVSPFGIWPFCPASMYTMSTISLQLRLLPGTLLKGSNTSGCAYFSLLTTIQVCLTSQVSIQWFKRSGVVSNDGSLPRLEKQLPSQLQPTKKQLVVSRLTEITSLKGPAHKQVFSVMLADYMLAEVDGGTSLDSLH